MFLYTVVNTLSVSFFIAYGRRENVFSDSVVTEIQRRGFRCSCKCYCTIHRHAVPGVQCIRVDTKYWDSVRLTLREEAEDNVIRVFLPRHYGATISDEDMAALNNHRIQYYLSYKGKSATTNRTMLQIDM